MTRVTTTPVIFMLSIPKTDCHQKLSLCLTLRLQCTGLDLRIKVTNDRHILSETIGVEIWLLLSRSEQMELVRGTKLLVYSTIYTHYPRHLSILWYIRLIENVIGTNLGRNIRILKNRILESGPGTCIIHTRR